MNAPIITREKIQIDIADEIMSFTRKAGAVVCAAIGLWGLTCLVAALINVGAVEVIQGYFTAITGF
ncbi:hypothetical protein [Desulfocastanea catecholica]